MYSTCSIFGILGEGLQSEQGEHREHSLKLHRVERATLAAVVNVEVLKPAVAQRGGGKHDN